MFPNQISHINLKDTDLDWLFFVYCRRLHVWLYKNITWYIWADPHPLSFKNWESWENKTIFLDDPAQTVSFDWFFSGLEWILNLDFCLLKLLIFYKKILRNVRSRLNYSTFWVKIEAFCSKKWRFWSNIFKYRLKNSKCGRVKPRSDIP